MKRKFVSPKVRIVNVTEQDQLLLDIKMSGTVQNYENIGFAKRGTIVDMPQGNGRFWDF